MNNEMRERIYEVLKTAADEIINLDLDGIAEKLINAGCVMPTFRIGQEVWKVNYMGEKVYPEYVRAIYLNNTDGSNTFYRCSYAPESEAVRTEVEDLIYATEAEARAALEEKE